MVKGSVLCREVVPISEGPLSEVPLRVCTAVCRAMYVPLSECLSCLQTTLASEVLH